MSHRHILTLTCPDRPGIVHAVCSGLLQVGGNILENAQFSEPDTGLFCMRTVVETNEGDSKSVDAAVRAHIDNEGATLRVRDADARPRVMILVSKVDHCLVDLLYRWQRGLLPIEIPVVVSNHEHCRTLVERYGIDFVHLPVTKGSKPAQEASIKRLLQERQIELVVLARYMQILSDDLCQVLRGRAINIHHSFLPGFKGARPYHQAHLRGVKLVGATAHFVTADLDEGPIIEQEVERVDHTSTARELEALGEDTERRVLSRAVRWWAESRILLVGNKTVVFS